MLRTVDLVYDAGVPVLGVNVGQLGYLTEVEPADLDDALDRLVAGDYEVAERMMLAVTSSRPVAARGPWWALNEAVLEKPHTGPPGAARGRDQRLVLHDLRGRRRHRRHADRFDRLLVLGPWPDRVAPHRCLLLTPVSPHMLFDRSLVLDARRGARARGLRRPPVVLTVDGRELGELAPATPCRAAAATGPARSSRSARATSTRS